jgi:hypothetical protein
MGDTCKLEQTQGVTLERALVSTIPTSILPLKGRRQTKGEVNLALFF